MAASASLSRREGARRADEFTAAGDPDDAAGGRRIIDVIGRLASTTPSGPVH
jgi:hypothetical protein